MAPKRPVGPDDEADLPLRVSAEVLRAKADFLASQGAGKCAHYLGPDPGGYRFCALRRGHPHAHSAGGD